MIIDASEEKDTIIRFRLHDGFTVPLELLCHATHIDVQWLDIGGYMLVWKPIDDISHSCFFPIHSIQWIYWLGSDQNHHNHEGDINIIIGAVGYFDTDIYAAYGWLYIQGM